MDDFPGARAPTPHATLLWLAVALARPFTAGLVRKLRSAIPDCRQLAEALSQAQTGSCDKLKSAGVTLPEATLASLNSDAVQRGTDSALDWHSSADDHHLLGLTHPHYPEILLTTDDPPPLLYAHGCLDALDGPQVAIVGSRKASTSALEKAHEIAAQLGASGIGVVSGLALGVDAAAHTGCLHGNGMTTAVLATAPDRVYPARHKDLAVAVASQGVHLTEFPLGSTLRPDHFPRRNRLISGLSLGVVVIEAALPSGSMTTAQHAANQGREVMAMPGSVLNPQAKGCHRLIRDGAALVEDGDDVLQQLASKLRSVVKDCKMNGKSAIKPQSGADSQAGLTDDADVVCVLESLGYDPIAVDRLVDRTGLTAGKVTGVLTHLELLGLIAAHAGGRYSRN